jgi:PAS domain S-box-containing protein
MTIKKGPTAMWVGLALILGAGLWHILLEFDRATRVDPQLRVGPESVARTYDVISTAQSLRRSVLDAERSQRTFLVTSDRALLDSYQKQLDQAPKLLSKLRRLTADSPEQQRRWPILEQQVQVKLAELAQTLAAYERGGEGAARQMVRNNTQRDSIDTLNAVVDAMVAAERHGLTQQLARAAEFEQEARKAAILGAALTFLLLTLGLTLILLGLRSMRHMEAARDDSERRFHYFVRGVEDSAIYMLDVEGRIIEWNAGAERIKGYAAHEIIGQHFSLFYTQEDRDAGMPARVLAQTAKEGKYEGEGWRVRKDSSRFYASVVIEAVHDTTGNLIGFAKITRDIEERIQQQQALIHYQKMDALGQLTGGIAHDFNNLLHVIKNATTLLELRLQDVGPDVRNYLDMLKRNAERASSLTQRLLAFSRRQILDPKPINPNTLVMDVSTLLEQVLGEGVAIQTVLAGGVWWTSVDEGQLETALLNIVINARDAMSGAGKLTIETSNAYLDEHYAAAHAEVKPGQYVMIAMSDTGAGMSSEVAAKAFDPFFTTKEIGQGTGLGLSQVYGFIKQSAGHVKIYSEPGEGTTVKLYLPRLVDVPRIEPAITIMPIAAGQHGMIVVVEDDDDVCKFTADALRLCGYRVVTARDAHSALRALEAEPHVDLLFTDIGLPGGTNGRALADEALKRFPKLRVLFTTGYTRNAVIHHGRLDPDVDLIVKPFSQSALAEAVKKVLGRSEEAEVRESHRN